MVHSTVRHFFQLVGAVTLAVAARVAFVSWRISSGPVNLDYLTSYIEEALSRQELGIKVKFDTTILAWGGMGGTLDIRALGVSIQKADDVQVAKIPEISLSLSVQALFKGMIAPKMIAIHHPVIKLYRENDGSINAGFASEEGEENSEVLPGILNELLNPPDYDKPSGYLSNILIADAEIVIEDRLMGRTWNADNAEIELKRESDGLSLGGDVELDMGDAIVGLDLNASYYAAQKQMRASLAFQEIEPYLITKFWPSLDFLKAADFDLDGNLAVLVDFNREIPDVVELGFNLESGKGKLNLPAPVATDYNIENLRLMGRLYDHGNNLEIGELFVNLGGPYLNLKANVADIEKETLTLNASGALYKVPVDDLSKLWPESLAVDARTWIVKHLSKGISHEATIEAEIKFTPTTQKVEIINLGGGAEFEGVTVNYLPPMPKAINGRASMRYDHKSLRLALKHGEVFNLRVVGGELAFTELNENDQNADFTILVNGPLEDALNLIEHKPLGFATVLGINPKGARGDSQTELRIRFPFEKTLTMKRVKVEAKSKVAKAFMPKVAYNLDLEDGMVELRVDNSGMDLKGDIILSQMPTQVEWRENFAPNPQFRRRYNLKGQVGEEGRKALGLTFLPFVAPYIKGGIETQATATFLPNGKGELFAQMELREASLALPQLAWEKPKGASGLGEVILRFDSNGNFSVPRFAVSANGLDINGQVVLGDKSSLKEVIFNRLKLDRGLLEGKIIPTANGLEIEVKGEGFDARRIMEKRKAEKNLPKEKGTPFKITAALKNLWWKDDVRLSNAFLRLENDGEFFQNVGLEALVNGNAPLFLRIAPEGDKKRKLGVVSSDAGALLKGLGLYENMTAGKLEVMGMINDQSPDSPMEAQAIINDFYVSDAPVLARLLTVAALTGIVDVLKGEGISFARLQAPFTVIGDKIYVHDAMASGAALGVTAKGMIDLEKEEMNLEGTIVPAYAVNSLLGNIPILGRIFSSEKGGGIFAATYTMRGPNSDPVVGVNPLAALAPGFLRNLFGIFDSNPAPSLPQKLD